MIIWQIPGWEYAVAFSPYGTIIVATLIAALFMALGVAIGIRALGGRIVNHAATRTARDGGVTSSDDLYRL